MEPRDWVLINVDGTIEDRFVSMAKACEYGQPGQRIEFSPEPVDEPIHDPFERDQTYKED